MTPALQRLCPHCGRKFEPVGKANADSDGFYYCEFCGCHTNARFRRCCDKGNEADRDKKAAEPAKDGGERCALPPHCVIDGCDKLSEYLGEEPFCRYHALVQLCVDLPKDVVHEALSEAMVGLEPKQPMQLRSNERADEALDAVIEFVWAAPAAGNVISARQSSDGSWDVFDTTLVRQGARCVASSLTRDDALRYGYAISRKQPPPGGEGGVMDASDVARPRADVVAQVRLPGKRTQTPIKHSGIKRSTLTKR